MATNLSLAYIGRGGGYRPSWQPLVLVDNSKSFKLIDTNGASSTNLDTGRKQSITLAFKLINVPNDQKDQIQCSEK